MLVTVQKPHPKQQQLGKAITINLGENINSEFPAFLLLIFYIFIKYNQ